MDNLIELRPYQQEAHDAVLSMWNQGLSRLLLVLPTGTGKTIVFASIANDRVREGSRVLILAHRGELLEQASDKLRKSTGLGSAVEKAEASCFGTWYRVVVGSVQTLMRDSRLEQFPQDYFTTIIVDEAHHVVSDSYQKVLQHFPDAKVLGVTATPDRGDMKDLGTYFEQIAYEYTLPQAIREKYLCPIRARTIPLQIDISSVGVQAGDFKVGEISTALDPYLEQIAAEMMNYCRERKTVVFLPLVKTSQKFRDILNRNGFHAAEVNGSSTDRAEVLRDFDEGKYNVLCNSMLLTEGWDCPSVDCIIVLRPTKVRSLYCLDEETEILTEDGWKKNSDVKQSDSVLAFDMKSGKTLFVPIIAHMSREMYSDEYFCSIKGPSVDIRVTNRHRMIYDNKRKKGWKLKSAEAIADMHDGAYLPVSGHGDFPGVPLSDDELRFIGWVMTDGTINKANNAIVITQESHQPWIEEIQKCIDGCGFKYNRFERFIDSGYKRTSPAICWTISKGKPRGRDKHLRGWGELERYISKDLSQALYDMTEKQFDIMLEAINLGDGHKQNSQKWTQRSYHISKGNKKFIERIQIMAIQRGWRASIAQDTKTNTNPIYTIHLKKQEFIKVGSQSGNHSLWKKEYKFSDEKCWCVQTELGTIVTRRNGKVTIMGNCQMVGRGTRLFPGKDHLLLLDFLWMTERHDLCHPASLICEDPEVAVKMTQNLAETPEAVDIEDAEKQASEDVQAQREEALAKLLAEQKRKKSRLVDPLQFAMSIMDMDLVNYIPPFGLAMQPPSESQKQTLEKMQINPEGVDSAGKADLLIEKINERKMEGMATPRQIRQLENRGFENVGSWSFEQARRLIDRIAGNGWRTPRDIDPKTFIPPEIENDGGLGW